MFSEYLSSKTGLKLDQRLQERENPPVLQVLPIKSQFFSLLKKDALFLFSFWLQLPGFMLFFSRLESLSYQVFCSLYVRWQHKCAYLRWF